MMSVSHWGSRALAGQELAQVLGDQEAAPRS